MKRILWISAIALHLFSCDNTPISQEFSQRIVVQAYLYAGEPVENFYLTELLPYGSDEDSIEKINDAQVSVIYNGNEFFLSRGKGNGHYCYNGIDLVVSEGKEYQIKIQYDDFVASATTIVPAPPENLQISDTVLTFKMTQPVMGGNQGQRDTSEIEISWNNGDNSYYYVLIENIDSVQESFFDGTGFPGGNGGLGRFMRRITEPAQTDHYNIRTMELQYYGNFRAKIFRVNQEYADLYQSLDQDSRNLTEPASNITNGLGIFTAFNSDSVFFKVIHAE